MASAAVTFKTLVCSHTKGDRDRILHKLSSWFMEQNDPKARSVSSILQQLCDRNGFQSEQAFINDPVWFNLYSYDSCESLIQIVASKLAIPVIQHVVQAPIVIEEKSTAAKPTAANPKAAKEPKEHRKAIPKKIRGEAWALAFGDSMKGPCYCCKKELHAFDTWHAGHIISHSNGGKDDVSNLRPTCSSCNLSMGTENMDDFKLRCYP